MAKFGLLLSDGDPAILEQVNEPALDGSLPASANQTPEQGLAASVDALFALGRSVMQDGEAIISSTAQLLVRQDGGRRSRKHPLNWLKRYGESTERACHEDVRRLVDPLVAVQDAESARGKVRAAEDRGEVRDLGERHGKVVALRTG